MATKPLVLLPDPILRQKSNPIERVDDDLRRLADEMLETMYDAPGIGLAAVQVAKPIRMLVRDVAKEDEEKKPWVLINPRSWQPATRPRPTRRAVCRFPTTTPRWSDRRRCGQLSRPRRQAEYDGSGWHAGDLRQHEIDHLNGVLFIDHISKLKRDMVIKKFTKLAKQRGGTRL